MSLKVIELLLIDQKYDYDFSNGHHQSIMNPFFFRSIASGSFFNGFFRVETWACIGQAFTWWIHHNPFSNAPQKRLCIYFLCLWLFVVISTYWQSTVIACYIILRCPRHLANMFNFIVIDEPPFVAVSTSPPVLSLQIFANSPSSYILHPKAFLPSPASHWLTPKLRKYQAQWNCLCSKTTHLFLFSPVEQHSSNHQYKIRIVFDCTPDKRIGWKKNTN